MDVNAVSSIFIFLFSFFIFISQITRSEYEAEIQQLKSTLSEKDGMNSRLQDEKKILLETRDQVNVRSSFIINIPSNAGVLCLGHSMNPLLLHSSM
jgi:hypothetical protein